MLKQEIAVYADERDYIRARLYEKTAPNIKEIVTSDDSAEILGIPAKSAFSNKKGGAK